MARTPERQAGVADADLSEKTALVTGSTSGIGRKIALALGRLGATVVVHGRDEARGRSTLDALADTAASGSEFLPADFASQSDVRQFAADVRETVGQVDLLFNNAGGLFSEGQLTGDGIEQTFAVNHLAPFLLTHLLLPSMSDDGRIVNTASHAHRQGRIDFDGFHSVDAYSSFTAYAQSQLARVLFTRELARRTDATANCFHPGFVPGSGFFRGMPVYVRIPMRIASALPGVGTPPSEGAATAVYLGAADDVGDVSGGYFTGFSRTEPSDAAEDEETASRLWELSEELVHIDSAERLDPPEVDH